LAAFIFIALVITGPVRPAAAEGRPIQVVMDTLPVEFDVQPLVENSRTLVPFRGIAEALGASVDWDQAGQTAVARLDDIEVAVPLNSLKARRNGESLALEVPARVTAQRIMMPLRFFTEAFGCQVEWDQENYRVLITSPARPMEVIGFYALGDARTSSWADLFGRAYPDTAAGRTDLLRRLSLGWYTLNQEGGLLTRSASGWQQPQGWEKVVAASTKYGLKNEMAVQMTDGRGELTALLMNETAMQSAADHLLAEVQAVDYAGVNLDLEGLGFQEQGAQLEATRGRLNHFVEIVAGRLAKAGRTLTLTVHPPNSAYPGYDLATLGRLADTVILMAYDYGPKPEPVGPVTDAIVAAAAKVPSDRLVLGISAASETAASIAGKVGLAKRYGLKGIALWRLGIVSDETWEALRSAIKAR
jgi:hypothetical protein